jgi:uncharacterized protein
MRVLVLCDDTWHPASIIRQGLAPLAEKGFVLDWMENCQGWSSDRIASYPIVILAKSNNRSSADPAAWIDANDSGGFYEHLQRGNGLLVLHSGLSGYPPLLRALMGGAFLRHPEQCPVTIQPKTGHVLARRVTEFTARDEHYFVDLDNPKADIFLTTISEHGLQPGGWTRKEGSGRVCVLTPGHTLDVWLNPAFQALVHNALKWCWEKIEKE